MAYPPYVTDSGDYASSGSQSAAQPPSTESEAPVMNAA